jgi:hypothetical protein
MSPIIAKACLNLNDWDKLKHYIEKLDSEDDEEEYEKTFFQAVLSIKEEDYSNAKLFIEKARNIVDDESKLYSRNLMEELTNYYLKISTCTNLKKLSL